MALELSLTDVQLVYRRLEWTRQTRKKDLPSCRRYARQDLRVTLARLSSQVAVNLFQESCLTYGPETWHSILLVLVYGGYFVHKTADGPVRHFCKLDLI